MTDIATAHAQLQQILLRAYYYYIATAYFVIECSVIRITCTMYCS
jgi:hypothetical protein